MTDHILKACDSAYRIHFSARLEALAPNTWAELTPAQRADHRASAWRPVTQSWAGIVADRIVDDEPFETSLPADAYRACRARLRRWQARGSYGITP